MEIHGDLHAHSAFAGGARAGVKESPGLKKKIEKRFIDSAKYSPLKGVNLIGTGDAQFTPWTNFLKNEFTEEKKGIFAYQNNIESSAPRYILQTELIFTGPIPDSKNKKRVHVLILFPNFTVIEELNELLDSWGVARENMARPFVVTESTDELNEKIHAILDLHPMLEMIPAHVLTPEGVYGGNNRVNFMGDFFGDSSDRFHAIETGLSADPSILGMIPELDKFSLVSNADAHSAALNRVGREFTTLNVNKGTYDDIIHAIRNNNIIKTAEFHITEGRYFLTGHRDERKKPGIHKKGQHCFYSAKHVPKGDLCPICKGELTIGVHQRAYEIARAQGEDRRIGDGPKRDFVTMIPLIEIVAHSLGIKSITGKKTMKLYNDVLKITGTEVNLWTNDHSQQLEDSSLPSSLIQDICNIRKGNFSFFPGGFDGTYGVLKIGETMDFEDIAEINF
ncbi:MAG: hypothetical protein INQ03_13525 [Candidatus Heimdallarchaeota archaeon]|nr:hypothetical protein [Candidatus Heimdallarchaeota archaeon]